MNKAVQKEKAKSLRLRGYSYNEIHRKLGVPKSTLSNWFSSLNLSEQAKERLKKRVYQGTLNGLVRRNKLQTRIAQQQATKIRNEAKKEVSKLKKRDLFMVGVALYWGEGHKKPIFRDGKERTGHSIGFTNTDPKMIQIFMRFLREIVLIPDEKIRINLRLFKEGSEKEAIAFWSNVTKLDKTHFQKTTRIISKSSKGKRKYNSLPHGTIQVRINDTKQFHRIIGWIDGVSVG